MGVAMAASKVGLVWTACPYESLWRDDEIVTHHPARISKHYQHPLSSAPSFIPSPSPPPPHPSVAAWWRTVRLYTDQTGANVSTTVLLGAEHSDRRYSRALPPSSYVSLPWFSAYKLRHLELYLIINGSLASISMELVIDPEKHQPFDDDSTIPSNHLHNFKHAAISLTLLIYAAFAVVFDRVKAQPRDEMTMLLGAAAFTQQLLVFHLHWACRHVVGDLCREDGAGLVDVEADGAPPGGDGTVGGGGGRDGAKESASM
ncbi:hypothetical protein Cni_G17244 [Canna indica]|uniref:Uncharacterized protein n=1 Tax=Canna indica TaxID=4628 RepID=A0AAQ3QGE2_9LILI|nr:hypothetical protein Cni_G17244 [Canna indica]